MSREFWMLKWILLLTGLFLVSAFFAMALPVDWMAAIHRWLGLGEFPDAPITIYLARSTSLLYGVHGTLMFYTGWTIDKHWRFVSLLGCLHLVIGTAMFLVDWTSGMPAYWTFVEGPPVAILGVFILFLAARAVEFKANNQPT